MIQIRQKLILRYPVFQNYRNIFSIRIIETFFPIEYHINIWQVSPQLICGDTCPIWMLFNGSNIYFCKSRNVSNGEIKVQNLSKPHHWPICLYQHWIPSYLLSIDLILFAEYYAQRMLCDTVHETLIIIDSSRPRDADICIIIIRPIAWSMAMVWSLFGAKASVKMYIYDS